MNSIILKMVTYSLEYYYSNSDKAVQAVLRCAALTAGFASLSGTISGTGGIITTTVSIGIILKMYFSLARMMGIQFGNSMLKALASAIVANLTGATAAVLAAAATLSLIPGVGSLDAASVIGLTSFCYVYLAGIIYIKMVSNLIKIDQSIENLTDEKKKSPAKGKAGSTNTKVVSKQAAPHLQKRSKKTRRQISRA